ncbi:MAG TPA: DUF885 domain-containing protein [Tepidisphaeraceae bacterium]|nr:DUF885 domain-containing protein [Tepidisphaeraceae bacterium]
MNLDRCKGPVGLAVALLAVLLAVACTSQPASEKSAVPAASQADTAFTRLAAEYLDDYYRRQPTRATFDGIHTYDDRLEDYSRDAVASAVASAKDFRQRVAATDVAALSASDQLDREQLLRAIDSRLLTLEVIRPWMTDPDMYSSGLTTSAYIMIKRRFAPPDARMRLLIAREKAMPAALEEAKKNLENPPRIYTEIALEQIDGNRDFFQTAVTAAFPEVTDKALLAEFKQANNAVVAAFGAYKTWLQDNLLKRSNGNFAFGEETYRRKLAADEMIDTPLEDLLKVAEADLRKNQAAFADTARRIDPRKTPAQILAQLETEHPAPGKLLSTAENELESLRRFMIEKRIVTIPDAPPVTVQETPPFMRATTTASMDIPGPFEKTATEVYYRMTLPDPAWPPRQVQEFMRGWYYALITNVSVHEVWPGHYLQFLYAKHFPSDIRKVFGAASNSEGWAHYCEQMVIDEGFHADDLRYRLAQIQDALLRNVRFIVGIRMHTMGMTVPQAVDMFIKEAYQPPPVARAESKRGTSDAIYGYYTMGKLMILKLRDDYKVKTGASYTLQNFHDTFIGLGPLPLPLMRNAMLGDIGRLF